MGGQKFKVIWASKNLSKKKKDEREGGKKNRKIDQGRKKIPDQEANKYGRLMNSIFTSNGLDNHNEMTSLQEEGLLPIGHLVTGRKYIYIYISGVDMHRCQNQV